MERGESGFVLEGRREGVRCGLELRGFLGRGTCLNLNMREEIMPRRANRGRGFRS